MDIRVVFCAVRHF